MNTKKIGQFIAALRKEKGLTQKALAEKLNISEKTVSKWECGVGMPDVGLMLPLCRTLDIDLNELLSGERLSDRQYKMKAEENLVHYMDKTSPRTKYAVCTVASIITILLTLSAVLLVGFLDMPTPLRVGILLGAFCQFVSVIAVILIVAIHTEIYECRHCGERFVPTMQAYIFAPHTTRKRYLKCPCCHKKAWNTFSVSDGTETT